MKIWLDDLRDPPDDTWEVARNYSDLTRMFLMLAIYGETPEVMSFDHDLGESRDGYDIIKWISRRYPNLYPLEVRVHSANPVGAENILKYDEWYRRERDGHDS